MQRSQWQIVALGAALTAVAAAVATGQMPRWLRVILVLGLVILAGGFGLYAYRYATQPTTLRVAVGSLDGDAPQLLTAIANRLASTGAPVRLKVLDKGTAPEAAKAFTSGETELAVLRADLGDLANARTVVVVTHGVVLIVAPPGSTIAGMDDLKGKTVGVAGGETNRKVVEALSTEYDLERLQVHFKDLALNEIAPALKSKQINCLLVVMPLSEKYLALLRSLFPRTAKQKPALVPIESAGAIAAVARYYKSFDLPKGTVQGSPPVPDDDVKTLRVPVYLVANKKLSDEVVGALAKSIMEARQDLLVAYPLLAQISQPNTDKTDDDSDTYIPIHPGASAYFGGDQKSFFDKHGDQIFYGSMLLGGLTSLFAGIWRFMTRREEKPEARPHIRLYGLMDRINAAASDADLAVVERDIDEIIKGELEKCARGEADAAEAAVLGLATRRLERRIAQRREKLASKSASATQAARASLVQLGD